MDDNLLHAVKQKISQVKNKYLKLNKKGNPRPPRKLDWLAKEMNDQKTRVDKSFVSLKEIYGFNENIKLDTLARTFCALEDFENWIEKTEIGAKKHQEEMEKQANHKIVRMKTFASLGVMDEKNDAPF